MITIGLAFTAGFFVGNGLPYYVQGSVGRGVNPSPFPDSPTINVVVGWFAILIGATCWHVADVPAHQVPGVTAAAVGVLVVGLIHARNWGTNPWRKQAPAVDPS